MTIPKDWNIVQLALFIPRVFKHDGVVSSIKAAKFIGKNCYFRSRMICFLTIYIYNKFLCNKLITCSKCTWNSAKPAACWAFSKGSWTTDTHSDPVGTPPTKPSHISPDSHRVGGSCEVRRPWIPWRRSEFLTCWSGRHTRLGL